MPTCVKCNKKFPNHLIIDGKERNLQRRKYCLKCSPFGQHNTKTLESKPGDIHYCKYCDSKLQRRQKFFCNTVCENNYYYNEYIANWKKGLESGLKGQYDISNHIKRYLFEKYHNSCCVCGWNKVNPYTNRVPLEVHHKDGNYENNNEENLMLLCPNCHSLTETYKNGNNGNGRKIRKKYYK